MDTSDVPELIKRLNKGDDDTRKFAALKLGELNDLRAVDSLILALDDENGDVRAAAIEGLGKLNDPRAINPIIQSLKMDGNPLVRGNAAIALGKLNDPKAIDPMIQVLKIDENPSVRGNAATALGKFNDPRVIDHLILALEDRNEYTRNDVFKALRKFNDIRTAGPLLHEIKISLNTQIRMSCLEMLCELNHPQRVDLIMQALRQVYCDASFHKMGISALGKLGKLGDPQAIDRLIWILDQDSDYYSKSDSVMALGEIKDPRVIDPLIKALQGNEVELVALKVLGMRKDAADPLIQVLNSNIELRSKLLAILVLGELNDPRAIDPLIRIYKECKSSNDRYPTEARKYVVRSLSKLNDVRAIDTLTKALKDKSSEVRETATEALKKFPKKANPWKFW